MLHLTLGGRVINFIHSSQHTAPKKAATSNAYRARHGIDYDNQGLDLTVVLEL